MTDDLAKPSGLTLTAHVRDLRDQCDSLFGVRPVSISKYKAMTGDDLQELVRVGVTWHDEGKRDDQWQNACQLDYQEFIRRGASDRPSGRHLQRAGIRHEMVSLLTAQRQGALLPLTVRVAIAAHHGKLSYRHVGRWSDRPSFQPYWQEFSACSGSMFRPHDRNAFDKAIRLRYQFGGPRALLQLADRRASALEDGNIIQAFSSFKYDFPHKLLDGSPSLRGVQRVVGEFKDEPFAILRAPTGSGKTDAALLWAQHQIKQERAERLVIAMPTRFTAGALSINVAESLSMTGLYHSSAFLSSERHEQEMARLLETPVTVTTIDHLCIALTGSREDHHAIFFNMANSCVVIDEADFYDDFTQRNIVVLLQALRLLSVPVLLMSATVPESAINLYETAGYQGINIYSDTSPEGQIEATRPRCNLIKKGVCAAPNDVRDILKRALDGEATIIYANTVKRAQAYIKWFRKKRCKHEVVLYHSRFTEPDKAKKERQLLEMLGTEAWKNGKPPSGIAILTQIGELSVNISADLMISDLCPIDRLAQRAGRLCRFSKKVGELFIVEPVIVKDDLIVPSPAPYGQWFSDTGWMPAPALLHTQRLLEDAEYSAQDFVEMVNIVYPEVPEKKTRTEMNERALRESVMHNWLIGPAVVTEQDDDDTDRWNSRDIPTQKTVFVNYVVSPFDEDPSHLFNNWFGFRKFELEHRIQCHFYEFDKALREGRLEKTHFYISSNSGDECSTEVGYVVNQKWYDYETGLNFDSDEDR